MQTGSGQQELDQTFFYVLKIATKLPALSGKCEQTSMVFPRLVSLQLPAESGQSDAPSEVKSGEKIRTSRMNQPCCVIPSALFKGILATPPQSYHPQDNKALLRVY